jgi:(2Fe-2S) ferredoxin
MSQFKKHVFICTYGPYCWYDGDTEALLKRLKRRVAEAGLKDEVRINRSGCLNQCGHGPMVVVYPDDVWYAGVQPDDADQLFDEHILNDQPVERLRFALPPGNNKVTDIYPDAVQAVKQVEKDLDVQREVARQRAREESALDEPEL